MSDTFNHRNLLMRRVIAAVSASLAIGTILSLVGYSDGASFSAFLKELAIAFSSYVPAALLVHWKTRGDKIWWDVVSVSFLGSALSFPLKVVFLEGQNGIPAYIARSSREQSWQPFLDLITHAASFVILTTLLALPFVAIAVLLWYVSRRVVGKPPRLIDVK